MTTRTYTYDPLGNITYKSDVGSYSYNPASSACAAGAGGGPHALRCIAGTVNGIVNPSFTYDANGNLISGLNRTLTYTSFNLPATITAPNNLVPGTNTLYTYVYNAEHERVKHIIQRTDGTFTTIYLHPAGKGALLYEKEIKPTLTEHKHYISAGGQLIGVYLTRSDGTTEMRYFHSDRLGSLTLITNAAGAQIERLAYEAYGKRRNPNGTDDPNNTLYGVTTDRGFTAHEHLDEIALIHMNGRIYDPLLGKFMTPDPFIQAPGNLQSYNRYAYVLDNPLFYTDPSGYCWGPTCWIQKPLANLGSAAADVWHSVWRSDIGQAAIQIVIAANYGPGGVAAYNAAYTKYQGGSWGDAAKAAAITYATAMAFDAVGDATGHNPLPGTLEYIKNVAGHALVGCVSSAASGGDCGSGAMGAGFAAAATPFVPLQGTGKLVAIAVIGGTASELGGGRFANGAVTAAFGYLYNSENLFDTKGEDSLNNRKGPIDQSGRTGRTGTTIEEGKDVPRLKDKIQVKVLDQILRRVTGLPGLVSRNPLTIAVPFALHMEDLNSGEDGAMRRMQNSYKKPN